LTNERLESACRPLLMVVALAELTTAVPPALMKCRSRRRRS
jgi:hypothetical protein